MAKKKKKRTPRQKREDLARFVLHIAYDTFAPGMAPEEFLEQLSMSGGHHHLLMQELWPEADDLEEDAYADALGEFESNLLGWLQEMQENHLFYKSIDGLPGDERVKRMDAHHAAQREKYPWNQ